MESLRKTARVLDVVARIAFWVTMVVGALPLLLWALNLRDPFFTKYMGGLLMAGNLNFTLAEPVNFPWGGHAGAGGAGAGGLRLHGPDLPPGAAAHEGGPSL